MEGAGRGRGGEKRKRLPANPMILKTPLWHFRSWINSNNRSPDDTNLLPSKSKQTPSDRFRICRNFTVKFGSLSHPERLGLACVQTSLCEAKEIGGVCTQARLGLIKDSYGTILADLCRAVWVKVVKNMELFLDRVSVQFLRSKNSEIWNVIRSFSECDRWRVCCYPNSAKAVYHCVNGCSKLHHATVLVARMFV